MVTLRGEATPSASSGTSLSLRAYESVLLELLYARRPDHLQPDEATLIDLYRARLETARMLDIGVGAGRTTAYFGPLVHEYRGVDCSRRMVRLARQRHPGLPVEHGDARDLKSLPKASYDFLLFSNCGLDGLDPADRGRFFAAARRVAAPGAILAFATHNRASLPPPRPWALGPLRRARTVRALMLRVALMPVATINYLRLKAPPHEAEGCIIVNDPAEGLYNLRVAYTSAVEQQEQLARFGWKAVKFIDMAGCVRSAADIDANRDVWFTVVATPA